MKAEQLSMYAFFTDILRRESAAEDGLFYRYDAGSDQRIASVQPMIERLSKPEQGRHFRFAYRAPKRY